MESFWDGSIRVALFVGLVAITLFVLMRKKD
jgi:hypothetical protein